ncbi:variant leucine-rich repeat-containing protein [Microbacterium hydrocarbonoxydans]|uniref:variant leucine-rich repeat-containing protein n=1 Tax=Microbacterium hydrocarbonoxydans TaxID=273678 RepID=UPI00203D1FB2|nr:hypothetical protein [Microbacterium hydrocarbonoxydans]MCM3779381.1 hypothetical protein [Microbacterium hydrocarbonoxydans]
MGEQLRDADLDAARNPHTPPAQLADIAARRRDLHPLLLGHPACYPQLREWMLQVNPAAAANYPIAGGGYAATGSAPLRPARRSRIGCLLIGCGGMVLVALVIVVFVVGAALFSGGGSDSTPDSGAPAPGDPAAAFEAERARFYELAAQLEGNPVAPLVTRTAEFERLEKSMAAPGITAAYAAQLAQSAETSRKELEQRIADATARRTNASGSVTEGIVDEAGAGFIDIAWDAATACAPSRNADEGRFTAGCVSEDPLAVHLAPEDQLPGDMGMRVVVLHELTHLYQRADSDTHPDGPSAAVELVEQGYFQGSSESMADCYALTYLDQWTLTFEGRTMGYGYVCGEEERGLIRQWAAEVSAPLP